MRITHTDLHFTREPLIKPFGFKGGYLHEIWQLFPALTSDTEYATTGCGVQNVLWSDATVFAKHSEAGGNAMMLAMTEYALQQAVDIPFETPLDLLDALFPRVFDYGKQITGHPGLRQTFALNALVGVDNAAWVLYCRERGIESFDEMIPSAYRPALADRQAQVAAIPLLSYNVGMDEIKAIADEGYFFFKIKIGADPDGDGDQEKMLAWDMERLTRIHEFFRSATTPHTESGEVPYYLDANGRYEDKDRLLRLLEHAERIGMLSRIMIVEEPFPEAYEADVSDIPVRLAADESAHTVDDARERIDRGYGAIALKPIAKTMSMSLKIAQLAHERGVPCFCADLTVCPLLVDWNKCVAARLAPLPGMKTGVLETNGHQNYRNWEAMKKWHPRGQAPWTVIHQGVFHLGPEFYEHSAGILEDLVL